MGHWSHKWEELHASMLPSQGCANLWMAAGLNPMIHLWEQRNQDAHGRNSS